MLRKILSAAMIAVMLAAFFTGCEQKQVEPENVEIANFEMPEKGEEIVVLTVKDYGEIKIKLFPELCPKGVENFTRLIEEQQYYDGIIFHRVIEDFMIQAGDPTGTGTSGSSIWGEGFEQEITDSLRHFKGALSYATSTDKLNKSQFFIVTGSEQTDESLNKMATSSGKYFSENVREKYKEVGGSPHLDGDYEIFGQVFEGLDIAEKISKVETDSKDKPTTQVVIEKAQVIEYDGE